MMLLPHNPLIAEPLFLTRYIEKAGIGLMDMYARCRASGLGDPQVGPVSGRGVVQVVRRTVQVTMQVAAQVAHMLHTVEGNPQKSVVMQKAMGLANLEHFRRGYRTPLSQSGWLVRTDPGSPNSPQQRYKLTDKGKAWLHRFNTLPKP